MNKLKKLQRKFQNESKSKAINDGLKQSKLSFKAISKEEEKNSDNEDKSESNKEEKEPLIESKNSKKGSKKK